jgi:cell division protein FtsB
LPAQGDFLLNILDYCGKIFHMKELHFPWKRLVILVVIIGGFFLLMNFFQRITELSRLSSERNQIKSEVLQLTATVQQIYTEIAHATSQGAVEEWAREEGHMVQQGDYLIVPVSPSNSTSQPILIATPMPTTVTNWEVWWALFFGK